MARRNDEALFVLKKNFFYHLWEIFGQEEAGINCLNDFKHYESESRSCPCRALCLIQSVVSWNNNVNDIKILAPQHALRLPELSDALSKLLIPSRTLFLMGEVTQARSCSY